ncbi:hypothetical protein BJ508DRAFT_312362 [Ascobolus immersus RN42]|uniref:Uncharacterized protein n=1 Tax=Ascobolus immersus RN42 TaxID=1160509 RepID=A0A3N4HSI1_ASCIM|nr:hypothetical protein BJ508DRAFT_312362 [Ascobolus immersus RN42]
MGGASFIPFEGVFGPLQATKGVLSPYSIEQEARRTDGPCFRLLQQNRLWSFPDTENGALRPIIFDSSTGFLVIADRGNVFAVSLPDAISPSSMMASPQSKSEWGRTPTAAIIHMDRLAIPLDNTLLWWRSLESWNIGFGLGKQAVQKNGLHEKATWTTADREADQVLHQGSVSFRNSEPSHVAVVQTSKRRLVSAAFICIFRQCFASAGVTSSLRCLFLLLTFHSVTFTLFAYPPYNFTETNSSCGKSSQQQPLFDASLIVCRVGRGFGNVGTVPRRKGPGLKERSRHC